VTDVGQMDSSEQQRDGRTEDGLDVENAANTCGECHKIHVVTLVEAEKLVKYFLKVLETRTYCALPTIKTTGTFSPFFPLI
jgi:hypothetical protein